MAHVTCLCTCTCTGQWALPSCLPITSSSQTSDQESTPQTEGLVRGCVRPARGMPPRRLPCHTPAMRVEPGRSQAVHSTALALALARVGLCLAFARWRLHNEHVECTCTCTAHDAHAQRGDAHAQRGDADGRRWAQMRGHAEVHMRMHMRLHSASTRTCHDAHAHHAHAHARPCTCT